jgi:hypothetical protein
VDEEGNIQVSAFEDDMTLIRVYARFGVAVARPLNADGSEPADPFVGASWGGASGSSATAARTRSTGGRYTSGGKEAA